jgi:hypothetical protein
MIGASKSLRDTLNPSILSGHSPPAGVMDSDP